MIALYKVVARPGEESQLRRAASALPDEVEGLDFAHVFFRGAAVFLALAGPDDPLATFSRDAKGKALVEAFGKHGTWEPDRPERHVVEHRRGTLAAETRRAREVPA